VTIDRDSGLALVLSATGPLAVDASRPVPLPALLGPARSWIGVPLASRGQPIGALVIASGTRRYRDTQADVAAAFAGPGLVAYENALLFSQLRQRATTDELTGLDNRRHFFDIGNREFATARRYGGELAAIMLDIDHFKRINDEYGHAVGDDVIRVVGLRLREAVRDVDIVGRYGGEEFGVVLPKTGGAAAGTARRILETISSAPVETGAGAMEITVSAGVAVLSPGDRDLNALLYRADRALYDAKAAGRNCVVVSTAGQPTG